MTKDINKKPAAPPFLTKKLTDNVKAVRDKHCPAFLKTIKPDENGVYPAKMVLVKQFLDYLGKFDSKFKGIHSDVLSSSLRGVYDIYKPIRKYVDKKEGKNTPQAKTRSKVKNTHDKKEGVAIGETVQQDNDGEEESPV